MSLAMMARTAVNTPKGYIARFDVREDTNDAALVHGILDTDEYFLREGPELGGWMLDVGAHVGTIGIVLALDHPDLRVIAIEPVPENAELIRRNVNLNGLNERVFVEEAGAAGIGASTVECHFGYTKGGTPDHDYVVQNRFIGNIWRVGSDAEYESVDAKALTISDLREKYEVDSFRLVKIDCEGCEWDFLRSGSEYLEEIIGEWHDGPPEKLKRLLRKSHTVEILCDYGGSGIFRAVRK